MQSFMKFRANIIRKGTKRMDKKRKSWGETMKMTGRALGIFYRRYPQMVISRLICVAWAALMPYVGIYLSACLIDELAGRRDAGHLRFLVVLLLFSQAGIALVAALLKKWKETQNAGMVFKVQSVFAEKFLDLDYGKMDETRTSELFSTIRQNENGGGWGLHPVLGYCEDLCSSVLTLLGGISLSASLFLSRVPESAGVYAILNRPLFLLLIIFVMLFFTWAAPALYNKAGSYMARHADEHNLGNRQFSFFGFLGYRRELAADVRIYRQDKICEKYNRNKESAFGSKGPFAGYCRGIVGFYCAASSAMTEIFTGVVYVFVCLKAWAGAFDLGAVTQYIASVTKVSGGLSKLIETLGTMRNNASFLAVVFEFLDLPNEMYQGSLTVEKRRDRNYEVEFRNVSFRYPGSDRYALKHVNMKFKIGERLAVVGMNGSGKTTFIKLLCRLYDPTEGEILLNGINIRKYDEREYRLLFAVVFQDFKLFALPLVENVASGSDYDEERARESLEKAGFGERLLRLSEGLATYLYKDYDKNGINISGGEAQKIAIARALYKDAPFIILDEPTAALDPIAEAEIYSRFNEIAGDKTAVYISHRLSSCRFCDEILVFHEGSVIQQGSHAELVADENGKYYELWRAQAQYYVN